MLKLLCFFACLQVAWLQTGPRTTGGMTGSPKPKPTGSMMTKGPMMTGMTRGMMQKPKLFNTFSSKFSGLGNLRHKLHAHKGVATKIDEYSGKFTASKDTTDPSKDKNRVEVSIYKCVEYDTMGDEIGMGLRAGNLKMSSHKVDPTSLMSKKFNFGSTKNATFGTKKTGGGMIDAKEQNFFTNASNGAKLEMMLFTTEDDGSFPVANNAENFEVKAGDIKFTLKVSGWTFCNNCNNGTQVGAALHCAFKIRSRKQPAKKAMGNRMRAMNGTAEEMDLGEGSLMTVSRQLKVDSNFQVMNVSYPKFTQMSGEESMMEIRVPKFNSDFEYDPTIGTTTAQSSALSVIFSPALLLVALAARFF